ncbi:hypothetical protein DES36_1336 [Alkalibaculum bacchi]|uniref:DUF2680 domain-containing protein n=1 Tax=Alkalibaculum bacchi TaxID=645887 RepID=A0A366HVS4_9FIRM|nr:hypothetical protein [Alkalibaculum bacchi]RBP57109.1 hypothetical protein DES36_1336 [Alkalibaculum bacchi]
MKKSKKILLTIGAATVVFTSSLGVAFAGNTFSPAEKLSQITGISVDELYEQKVDKTFGEIAAEKGVLGEFKEEMLESKKELLSQRVADGSLTQEEADEYYIRMKQNSENCDGTGPNNSNRQGLGFGNGMRSRMGNGNQFNR